MLLARSRRMWFRNLVTRDTKAKITWSFFIFIFLVVFIDSFGFVKVYFEKDFETEFSYPLDTDDFPGLVNRFRRGDKIDYEPTNTNYSAGIKFLHFADEGCGEPLGLLILVKSAPSYFDKRDAIRRTWGDPQYLRNISKAISPSSPLLSCFRNQFDKKDANNLSRHHHLKRSSPFPIKLVFLLGLNENDSSASGGSGPAAVTQTDDNYLERDTFTRTSHKAKGLDHLTSFSSSNQLRDKDKEGREDFRRHTTKSSSRVNWNGRRRGRRKGNSSVEKVEESLREEILRYNDIVRGDFLDCYDNNTYKTMMGLRWGAEICTNFQFALLADDDMYINFKNVLRFLENPTSYPYPAGSNELQNPDSDSKSQIDNLYAGKVIVTRPVRSKLGSKWYLTLDEYPFNYFPPYIPAAAVLMSRAVVNDFYYAAHFTGHFRFDDIFLAIMAHKMKITPLNSNYFHVCHTPDGKCHNMDESKDEMSKKGMDPMENVIARHGLSGPKELIQLWNEQKRAGKVL